MLNAPGEQSMTTKSLFTKYLKDLHATAQRAAADAESL